MYELIRVGKSTYYINCPAKMGFYVDDGGAYLIDSGNDKDAGRKIDKHLKEQGWKLKMIINTHSNADHIGGNKVLAERWGCPVFGKGIEAVFTEYPLLESSFLFGAYPPKELRNKFLMAQASSALNMMAKGCDTSAGDGGRKGRDGKTLIDAGAPRIIASEEFTDEFRSLLPAGMEFVNLPGHFFDMVGIKTPDDVWFMADCVSSKNIMEKYHISFIYDIRRYLETLGFIEKLNGKLFVPAHTEPQETMKMLAKLNRDKVNEICKLICEFCCEPVYFEKLLAMIFAHYDLVMDFNQYVLVGSTVKSYLAYLAEEGRVEAFFENNMLKWKSR